MNTPLVVGNWKMHGTQSECFKLARKIAQDLRRTPTAVEVVLAPPFTGLAKVRQAIRHSNVGLAAQNSHWQESGAYTGEVSPAMLRDIGCAFIIVGHSERRHIFHEDDRTVAQKIQAALRNGLRPILCIGETLAQRRAGRARNVIHRQLRIALKGLMKNAIDKIEIAYEPVWAIGTGQNATREQISQAHGWIRRFLEAAFGKTNGRRVRILYGGSVKPDNASALITAQNVNGLLVGGASLNAETLLPIVRCFTVR